MKYFLFGSMFIDELSKYMELTDSSPTTVTASLTDLINTYFSDNKKVREKYCSKLSKLITKNRPDFFIFDLRCFAHLYDLKPSAKISTFIDTLLNFFEPEHIILIRTTASQWFTIGTQLRENKNYKKEILALNSVKSAENYFIELTNCKDIDIAKYYFYKKQPGYQVATYLYEDECYIDTINKLKNTNILDVSKELCPDFKLSLNRYIRHYYENTVAKAFQVFFNIESVVDSMVLDSPGHFVEHNYDNFITLKMLESTIHILPSNCTHYDGIDDCFLKLFYSYKKLYENDYYSNEVDYRLPFYNGIVPKSTLNWIKKQYNDVAYITTDNAGYYFALVTNSTQESALNYISSDIDIQPTLIDIFGSCISKTCFDKLFTKNTKLCLNQYFFQLLPYRTTKEQFYFPELDKSEPLLREKLLKYQLEGTLNNQINDSCSEWFIIDLYSLCTGKTYEHQGLIFVDYYNILQNVLHCEPLTLEERLNIAGGYDGIFNAMTDWCNSVISQYKERIIMIDTKFSRLFLGDDDKLYNPFKAKKTYNNNNFIEKIQNYLRSTLNCYFIQLSGVFFADDKGFLTKIQCHYELAFYREVYGHILNIVENRPLNKIIDTYSNNTRIERLLRLLPHNDIRILRHYFDNIVDEFVLQLPTEIIVKYRDIILNLYNSQPSCREDITTFLLSNNNDVELIELFNNSSYIEKIDLNYIDLEFDYPYLEMDDMRKLATHFTIHFDGNGADEGDMDDKKMLYGKIYRLPINQFKRKGYTFKGWTTLRQSDGKTAFFNGKVNKYYLKGSEPSDTIETVYIDNCKVKCCSKINNDIVNFIAQWELAEKETVI